MGTQNQQLTNSGSPTTTAVPLGRACLGVSVLENWEILSAQVCKCWHSPSALFPQSFSKVLSQFAIHFKFLMFASALRLEGLRVERNCKSWAEIQKTNPETFFYVMGNKQQGSKQAKPQPVIMKRSCRSWELLPLQLSLHPPTCRKRPCRPVELG